VLLAIVHRGENLKGEQKPLLHWSVSALLFHLLRYHPELAEALLHQEMISRIIFFPKQGNNRGGVGDAEGVPLVRYVVLCRNAPLEGAYSALADGVHNCMPLRL